MTQTEPLAPLRRLPQVQRLLETAEAERLLQAHPRTSVVAAVRRALDEARASARKGGAIADMQALVTRAGALLSAAPSLQPVINATGIVLHTNLGRAPLPKPALEAMARVGAGYCNVEFDLARGERGHRTQAVEPFLTALTGAEDALAVNNAAAALLLALSALAAGGEVIVSRGELVEIGGGFRIPDVIVQGGARLVEVGTTNRTRLADYKAAVTEHTRAILKVHASNYRVIGFTADVPLPELASLARERGVPLVHDLGSGAVLDLHALGRQREPTVQESLAGGADLVAFSGDKLFGGPQAGLVVGRAAILAPLRRHPLMRALRLDKITLAALEATLRLHRDPARAACEIPVLRALSQTEGDLQARAERLASSLAGEIAVSVTSSEAFAGGGAMPGRAIASRAVVLNTGVDAEEFARRLRAGAPPVVGRIFEGELRLDMATVADEEIESLAAAIHRAAGEEPPR